MVQTILIKEARASILMLILPSNRLTLVHSMSVFMNLLSSKMAADVCFTPGLSGQLFLFKDGRVVAEHTNGHPFVDFVGPNV